MKINVSIYMAVRVPSRQGLLELVVDGNGLTTLPDLRACAKLRRISCCRCRIIQLPAWLGECTQLVELDASANRIASPLPSLRARGVDSFLFSQDDALCASHPLDTRLKTYILLDSIPLTRSVS